MSKSKELRDKLVGMYETAQPCSEARKDFVDTLTTMVALCMLDLMAGDNDHTEPSFPEP